MVIVRVTSRDIPSSEAYTFTQGRAFELKVIVQRFLMHTLIFSSHTFR